MLFSDEAVLDGVGLDKDREPVASTSGTQDTPMEIDTSVRDDGFGTNLDQNIICMSVAFDNMYIGIAILNFSRWFI